MDVDAGLPQLVPSRRLVWLDRDLRFDLSRRLLEARCSAAEQASRRLDREFSFARRSNVVDAAGPIGTPPDSARAAASSRSRRSLTSGLRNIFLLRLSAGIGERRSCAPI